jgi:hypothetical protein
MFRVLGLLFGLLHRFFYSRPDLLLENLALRQQLLPFQRRNPKPRLRRIDRLFWVMARKLWSKWKQALMYVTPETVTPGIGPGFVCIGAGSLGILKFQEGNGLANRCGACRQDLLDHVIPLNEKHLKRLLAEYVHYFHHDRTHLGLEKDTPHSRPVAAQTPGFQDGLLATAGRVASSL